MGGNRCGSLYPRNVVVQAFTKDMTATLEKKTKTIADKADAVQPKPEGEFLIISIYPMPNGIPMTNILPSP